MNEEHNAIRSCGRRRFFSQLSAAAGASGLAWAARSAAEQSKAPAAQPLPTIALGQYRVTRLIAGSNPINGYSYLGPHVDRHMKEYFTPERTVEFLQGCERAGINTHQFSAPDRTSDVLRTLRDRGSKMHFICLHADRAGVKATVEATRPIAVVHHGGVTDRLFHEGKSGQVRDYVKAVHDCGVLAGVSAHDPDSIRKIADEGWEVDFFMTCFYFLTRKKVPPQETLQVSYPFFAADPAAMTRVVRQVKQPCLGFKILAAGRKCGSQEAVKEAFRFAYENIKPIDAVIVGMYPRFFDEVRANAQFARQYAARGEGLGAGG